ncbi:MAG: VOC family protein [Chloroflexi bacterium]|nr:VOC family protein [Chloroflexota bacterium]
MAHGDLGHLEIPADDIGRARRFYEDAFGWTFSEVEGYPNYVMFHTAAGPQAGGGAIGERGVSAGNELRNYVGVDSIDQALPRIEQLGGSVVQPKEEVPGQGWYAVVNDPEGNKLGLWESLEGSQ